MEIFILAQRMLFPGTPPWGLSNDANHPLSGEM